MNARRGLLILLVISAAVRMAYSSALGPGNDEAYHWLYAIHPSLSYFDHPPMMAWVEMLGLTLTGGRNATWALRIGFVAMFAGSTIMMYRLAARHYGERAGLLAATAMNLTGYYGLAASTFALPDGPLLFFWLLTLDRLDLAIDGPDTGRSRRWTEAGLAWGGALLSKYHAVFLPVGVVGLLLIDPRRRKRLLESGPYLAIAIGLMVFSPVLIWNARHGWISFVFQGGRAVGGWTPRPDLLGLAMLAQAGYLFPWIWIPMVILLVRGLLRWRSLSEGPERLWLAVATIPTLIFALVACFRPVLPHWGLIGLVSIFPMLGRVWAVRIEAHPRAGRRRLGIAAGLSMMLVSLALVEHRTGLLQRGPSSQWAPLDERTDPTLDFQGWDQVADRIRELGLVNDPGRFLFTRYWYQSAQIAYALGGERPVLCYNSDDPRGFAFWSRPDDWIGHDGVLVMVGNEPDAIPRYFRRWFATVEFASEFWVERHGKPVRRIRLYQCRGQRLAYPFDIDRARHLSQRSQTASKGNRAIR